MDAWKFARPILLGTAAAAVAIPAAAQNRTSDNALTQAEDAFGFSVGREAIGIYNAGQTRGFSPTAAGNVRLEGLYFSPTFGLQGGLVGSTSIRVGLSAQGYPFVAPSGVFDQSLRRPTDKFGASLILAADGWGGRNVEVDLSVPINERLGVRAQAQTGRTVYPNDTDNFFHTEALVVDWRPTDTIQVTPFWALFNDYDDEAGTFYIPAGSYIPPVPAPRSDESPEWSDNRFTGMNTGVLVRADLTPNLQLRVGAFRSTFDFKHNYTFFLTDEQPDGTGNRLLIANPRARSRSSSGEVRLSQSVAEGPRLHLVHLSLRGRDVVRPFGGSAVVSFGPGAIGEQVKDPKPDFVFGPQSRSHLKQVDVGIAYDGRWKDVGELSLSLARANFRKTTSLPNLEPVEAKSSPWLYNGTIAFLASKSLTFYAGVARGLEESGLAPPSAANQNEPLESIITRQKDIGARVDLGGGRRLVAGLFSLERPYFGFDTSNIFRQVGSVRSKGAEFSVSGPIVDGLNMVAGGVFFRPKVSQSPDATGMVGSRPAGLPTHILTANLNWSSTGIKGVQFDLGASHRGNQAATVDNLVTLPSRWGINAGARYGFKLAGRTASLRIQATNLNDNNDVTLGAPGVYSVRTSRQINASLTIDQ